MKQIRGIILVSIMMALSLLALWPVRDISSPRDIPVFSNQTLVRGSTGGDVYELQGRLKFLGFYKGAVDGIFGWRTYWAVRNFQYRFGIRVDGIVGPETKNRLYLATRNYRPQTTGVSSQTYSIPHGRITSNDFKLLARTVYGEARGEPFIGQVAVAATILNRLESPLFPKTIAGIIFQPGAFTSVADGQIWLNPDQTAYKAASDALNGWDPSGGALYYFNPATATSKWIWSRPQIKRIGKHIFTR